MFEWNFQILAEGLCYRIEPSKTPPMFAFLVPQPHGDKSNINEVQTLRANEVGDCVQIALLNSRMQS